MVAFKTIDDLQLRGRKVLLRVDLNVPLKDGVVTNSARIDRVCPTISELVDRGARVILLSHLGRPKGQRDEAFSLRPLVQPLSAALQLGVGFCDDCIGPEAAAAVAGLEDGEVLLLENLRFHAGEEAGGADFVAALARLGDLFVNDAFGVAHRAHASVDGLAQRLPAAAGRLMQEELTELGRVLEAPVRPRAAIVGGAKVSTKLELLENLVAKMDLLIVGGGMANTFLHAFGQDVGASLCEHEMAETALAIAEEARSRGCDLLLPSDALVAAELAPGVATETVSVKAVPAGQMILDIGPRTAGHVAQRISDCRTLVWNGPFGCFEVPPFDGGTNWVAATVAELTASGSLISVAGGGDTVAALDRAGVLDRLTYVSTAGGAFLEWLEGKTLPGVAALEAAAARPEA